MHVADKLAYQPLLKTLFNYTGEKDCISLVAGSQTTSVRANQEQVVGERNIGSTSISSRPRPTRRRAAATRVTRPATKSTSKRSPLHALSIGVLWACLFTCLAIPTEHAVDTISQVHYSETMLIAALYFVDVQVRRQAA